MIRAALLILGLWLGLCLAVLLGGSVGHLRQVSEWTGWPLPAWTTGLEPASGFLRGEGQLQGARLDWALSGISGFRVGLSGPDWQASGFATPAGETLVVDDLAGVVPLGWLDAGTGALGLEGGSVSVGLDGTVRSARIEGTARGAEPSGPVLLEWAEGWVLTANP